MPYPTSVVATRYLIFLGDELPEGSCESVDVGHWDLHRVMQSHMSVAADERHAFPEVLSVAFNAVYARGEKANGERRYPTDALADLRKPSISSFGGWFTLL